MECKQKYWKQRNTATWVTLGDENSSFFQAMANQNNCKKFIGSLTIDEDILVTNHEQNDAILWNAFKDRMGRSDFHSIHYDLTSLLHNENLFSLIEAFSLDEVNSVLKDLPNSHARGPDGFNGLFIKKCWHIIKENFLRYLNSFNSSIIDISSLNSSCIVLIPKKSNPVGVNDYKPISLLNYSLKCLTKLLFVRLQSVITKLVYPNQYGFIKGRTIQDCLAWAFQFHHVYLQSKKR